MHVICQASCHSCAPMLLCFSKAQAYSRGPDGAAGCRNFNGELFPDQSYASCSNATVAPIIIGPACSPMTGASICGQPQLQTMFECAHPTSGACAAVRHHMEDACTAA